MRILCDMDGVVADWGAKWDQHAAEYLHLGLKLTSTQDDFDLSKGLSEEGKRVVYEIMNLPDFYRSLRPIEGAAEALNAMLDEGHDVHLATSPMLTNHNCASDKLWWSEQHLGKGWGKRTILTMDKTILRGDVLIDDKPEVLGSMTPEWEHVYFTQPYNRQRSGRRISSWTEWRDVLCNHNSLV